jgi:hypothetical protein
MPALEKTATVFIWIFRRRFNASPFPLQKRGLYISDFLMFAPLLIFTIS